MYFVVVTLFTGRPGMLCGLVRQMLLDVDLA
jgi:hypothetical protein